MKIRARSIFAKIVLWFVVTVLLTLVGFVTTSVLLSARISGRDWIVPRVQDLFLNDARQAYELGGKEGLAEYLDHLNSFTASQYMLTDARGIDLVSGGDRSDLLARRAARLRRRMPWAPWLARLAGAGREHSLVTVRNSDDRRYHLVTVFPPPPRFSPWDSIGYFAWLPILIAALCYVLAVHLASPLRHLRRVVEKFGLGELGARFHVSRRDEIGELAQAFNRMADQIETLLSAERRLLQDVSHELRSPLARLGFAVELARTSPDREAALGRIRKEADRLNQLVDELLQLTRAEGDPAARDPENISMDKLLRDVLADCAMEAEAQGCRLALDIDRPVELHGEWELLRRACENVVRNAIRHAPAETSVEVDLAQDDGVAAITVRDHGPGVPHEALHEIFKPFYRVEGHRDRSSGGVGLGLSIARRAAELHRGRIRAWNANPGLCVSIELPTRPDQPALE